MPVRFQVDPDFYDHPKTIGMSDAAFSLWVRAGSFSVAKLTDGFISEDVLTHTLRAEKAVADELSRRGLWRRVKGGYRFHEWDARNLTKARVEDDRKADRDRKRQRRAEGTNSAGQNGNHQANGQFVRPESSRNPNGIQPESGGIPRGSVSVSVSESVSGSGRGAGPSNGARPEPLGPRPPIACREHQDDPDPPACRRCKAAREKAEAWDAAALLADVERRRMAPQCAKHPGQFAHNCGPCRSEQIGRDPDDE